MNEAKSESDTSVAKVAFRGMSWNLVSRVFLQIVQFAVTVITAHILSPNDFGRVALILVFSGFVQVLADLGLNSALIHADRLSDLEISTAFWLQVLVGAAMSLVFFLAAPALASFYGDPDLSSLTRLLSGVFVLQALGQTQIAMAQREYRFKIVAISNIIASVLSNSVCICLAISGFGATALALQIVLNAGLLTMLMWNFSAWRPIFAFSKETLKYVLHYGGFLSGHTILNYWLRNADNLLIGKFIGVFELGLYSRAYALMMMPLNTIGIVVGQVMFPIMSRLREDMDAFRRVYLSAISHIALITFPLMTCMAVSSDEIISITFGANWIGAAAVLRILSLVGLVQSIVYPVGWVFTALGKTKDQFYITVSLMVPFAVLIIFGLKYGILGVTAGYAIWAVISCVVNLKVAMKIIDVSVLDLIGSIRKLIISTSVAGALGSLAKFYMADTSVFLSLAALIAVMGGSYAAGLLILREEMATRLVRRFISRS